MSIHDLSETGEVKECIKLPKLPGLVQAHAKAIMSLTGEVYNLFFFFFKNGFESGQIFTGSLSFAWIKGLCVSELYSKGFVPF